MNKKQKLEEFAEALAFTLYNTDAVKWPIRSKLAISAVGHFYAKEYMEQLLILVRTYNTNDWHKAFSNSLSLLKVSHHIIDGLEKAQKDKHDIAEDILRIVEVSSVLSGYTLLTSKNHIILSKAEVEVMYDCYEQIKDTRDLGDLLKLSALLWAYADAVYFQGKEMCCEYHGLYTLENGLKVLIRDYKNFNPVELWPEIIFHLEPKEIRIVTFHKNDFSIAVDVYNNIHILNSSFKDSCVGGLLFVDGRIREPKIIRDLMDMLLKELEKQTRFVNKLSVEKLYQQYVYLFWYRKKYLTDYLGLSWKPSQKVLKALKVEQHVHDARGSSMEADIAVLKEKYDYSAYIDQSNS